jgi:hypothetical protein
MEQQPQLLIDAQLAQAVIYYLQRQPYEQVHVMISALLALKECEPLQEQSKTQTAPQ